MAKSDAKSVLKRNGAKKIEGYELINNYGYTFEIDGKRFDARFWANCYGCAMNVWQIHSASKDADGNPNVMDDGMRKKIESELNAECR